ncbi:MAG: hypothetical protein H0W88_05650 [Parachlamydiaceae bacterium]|nr:hypothetical protein [Parachlamydiaceae bacterium]
MASKSHSNLSIIEAVETLSNIADLELDRDVGVAQKHEIVLHNEKIAYKTVHWLHEQDATTTVSLVRETFRVVLHFLKQFYKKEYSYVSDPKTIEGIKTIMVLVGEAAKKLDKYTNLFHESHKQSVMELKEFKQLQDFYLSKIARKIDEEVLSRWILGLTFGKLQKLPFKAKAPKLVGKEAPSKIEETKHLFIDLETVKKDTEYELFFIRKEDGSRFFSPRLLRNIKLVCDFGDYFGETKELDPIIDVKKWLDRVFHESAVDILKAVGNKLNVFFHDIVGNSKDEEFTDLLKDAFMALMLSSHNHNLLQNKPVKSCGEYFVDFQGFLRDVLNSRVYQKWIAYPPKENNVIAVDTLDIIHTVCSAYYSSLQGLEEMVSIIDVLIHDSIQKVSAEHLQEAKKIDRLWSKLGADYIAMTKLLKGHPNGPLFKVLDVLEENALHLYDPIMQHNIPSQLFDLYVQNHRIENIRFACPISQEFINKAVVNEEFKGFLRDYTQSSVQKKHLLFNLQDRTSWREHARSVVLEELQHQSEFEKALCVVTLAIDTDFFHQLAPYHQVNHATTFIDQFKEHLKGEGSGFYFPPSINKKELFNFIDKGMELVHRIFFSNKNVLLREHRLDFIEIFYLFLQLKLIDMVKPNSFSFTCKDGIDVGMAYNSELFVLLKFINLSEWNESDRDYLNFLIYTPAILYRERVMLPDRFNRMLSAIRTIESAQHEYGKEKFSKVIEESFASVFNTPILGSMLLLPS